jgi:hypothetical protein
MGGVQEPVILLGAEWIQGAEGTADDNSGNMLVLDQSNAGDDDAERDEIILSLRFGYHLEDFAVLWLKVSTGACTVPLLCRSASLNTPSVPF